MSKRTIENNRLIDGERIDNLPSDTNTELDLKEDLSNKGQIDGYAELGGDGKVPETQLPDFLVNGMIYKGEWDASSGIFPGESVAQTGYFYTTSVGGTVDSIVFNVGDRLIAIIDNASISVYASNWTKLDATDAVTSVAGRLGNVILNKSDVSLGNVDNTSDTNKPVSSAQQTALNLKTNNTDSVTSVAGIPTGGDRVSKIISLTQAEYDAVGIPDESTQYIITDADIPYPAETTTTIGTLINGADAKTTPVDTDLVPIRDVTGGLLEKVTWANIKATLKTYFDTLYGPQTMSINAQTGVAYTLLLIDKNKLVTLTNVSAIAVTIPTNASVAFPIGTQIDFSQDGAGKVTFSGTGVTIVSQGSYKSIGAQGIGVTLIKTATDTWNLYGNLIA